MDIIPLLKNVSFFNVSEHLPYLSSNITSSMALSSLQQVPELRICYHVGLAGSWVVALPFRLGGALLVLIGSILTFPVRALWWYLLSPVLSFLGPWLWWLCSPVVWVLTSRVVTYLPLLLYRCMCAVFVPLAQWGWWLVATPLSLLWHYLSVALGACGQGLWWCLGWVPTLLPLLVGLGIAAGAFFANERLEPKHRRRLYSASGAVIVAWATYLLTSLATLLTVIGVPLSVYAYVALGRSPAVGKAKRMGLAGGLAVGAVFSRQVLTFGIAIASCPGQVLTGYSGLLPVRLAGFFGHGIVAGLLSVGLTLLALLALTLLHALLLSLLQLMAEALFHRFCSQRRILTPPAVFYEAVPITSPQFSTVLQGMEAAVPPERVEAVLRVTALHRAKLFKRHPGEELLLAIPVEEAQADCHLCLTHSWCSSPRCGVCGPCHSGPPPWAWPTGWAYLPSLSYGLASSPGARYLVVCRAKRPLRPAPWWTRLVGSGPQRVWVPPGAVLPIYVLCLRPAA